MKSIVFVFVSSLYLIFTGCLSGSDTKEGGARSQSREAPVSLSDDFLAVNAADEDSFSIEGKCSFTGDAVLHFYQDESGGLARSKRVDISCTAGVWVARGIDLSNFEDGDLFMEVLIDNKPALETPFTLNKDIEIPTFTESGSLDGFIVQVSDHLVRASGTCSEDGEVSVAIADIEEDWVISCEKGVWSGDLDFSAQADGAYGFEITFADKAGNEASASVSGSFDRDTEAPVLTVTASTDGSNSWSLSCDDAPCTYAFVVNDQGATIPTEGFSTYGSSESVLAKRAGINYIHAKAKDAAGNESEVVTGASSFTLPLGISGVTVEGENKIYYREGERVTFRVTFNGSVDITGRPGLVFNIGSSAVYEGTGETGVEVANFVYTVGTGDHGSVGDPPITVDSLDLTTTSGSSINIAGGTTSLSVDNPVLVSDSTLPSEDRIIIDNTPPTLTILADEWLYRCGVGNRCRYTYVMSSTNTPPDDADYPPYGSLQQSQVQIPIPDGTSPGDVRYFYLKASDPAGNETSTNATLTVPVGVSTAVALISGSYKQGSRVQIRLTFNGDVDIKGEPFVTITLDDGTSGIASHLGGDQSGVRAVNIAWIVGMGNAASVYINKVVSSGEEYGGMYTAGETTHVYVGERVLISGLTVDNTPPVVAVTQNPEGTGWSWSCNGTETCRYSHVVNQESSAPSSGDFPSSYGTTTEVSPTGSGTYYVHVRARDAAGNISDTVTSDPVTVGGGTVLSFAERVQDTFVMTSPSLRVKPKEFSPCLSKGSGDSSRDPLILCTYDDLNHMRENLDESGNIHKYYALGANIDATPSRSEGEKGCVPYNGESIALQNPCSGWVPLPPLSSDFDGRNYEIHNLYINAEQEEVGFFTSAVEGSTVKNLHLKEVRVHNAEALDSSRTGGITGGFHGEYTLHRSSVTGKITALTGFVGGLTGLGGFINQGYARVTVEGGHFTGGLVGYTDFPGGIYASFVQGLIVATQSDSLLGELTGGFGEGVQIQDSHADVVVLESANQKERESRD